MNRKKTPQPDMFQAQQLMAALSLGCDVENRCIFLMGTIDEESAYRFLIAFKTLDRTPGPIHLILCTSGGSIYEGLAIYDAIRCAQNPTMVEGMGLVASAGVPILLAGGIRFLNPETKVMVHHGSFGNDGGFTTPVLYSVAKEAEALNNRYVEIIAQRTGRSVKDIKQACVEERHFTAEEAVDMGLADRVTQPRPIPANYDEGFKEIRAAVQERLNPGLEPLVAKSKKKRVKKPKRKAVRANRVESVSK